MFAALQELNQKFCDPPKSDGELSRLVTWVMQKEPNTKGPAVTFSQERPMEKPETLIKTISALRKAVQESHATPYLIQAESQVDQSKPLSSSMEVMTDPRKPCVKLGAD